MNIQMFECHWEILSSEAFLKGRVQALD